VCVRVLSIIPGIADLFIIRFVPVLIWVKLSSVEESCRMHDLSMVR
jgi:hypothetical protein